MDATIKLWSDIMALNKGYLTAKTDKASDEVYTQVR